MKNHREFVIFVLDMIFGAVLAKKNLCILINSGCNCFSCDLLKKKGRKQMTFTHQETLPAENDAACPHLGNWLCMYLNMNKYKIVTVLIIIDASNRNPI